MKQYVPLRIESLQEKLRELDLDAAIIYDRENLIYFANVTDLEGGVLCIPAQGEAELFCLPMDARHVRELSGLKVTPYPFPASSNSLMAAKWLAAQGIKAPRVGFTRYFISLKDYQCLMAEVPDMVVGDIAVPCYQIRSVKCAEEIERIRKASAILEIGMEAAVRSVRPGMLETEVLAEAEYAMRKAGSEGSSFRMQVLRHDRQLLVHPYAGAYELRNNEPVVIHLGATVEGYGSKMCRTVFLGNVSDETKHVYDVIRKAQEIAVEALKPGVLAGEIYDRVFEYIESQGFGKAWLEHIGYGVGIRQSEFYPIIAKGSTVPIEENMVVDLLLPTIYRPGIGGPRLTDTLLVTATGAEYLTNYDRTPVQK